MPRPTKCRRVCYFPEVLEISPTGAVKPISAATTAAVTDIAAIIENVITSQNCNLKYAIIQLKEAEP